MSPQQRTVLAEKISTLIETSLGKGSRIVNFNPIYDLIDQYSPKSADFYVSGHIPFRTGSGKDFKAKDLTDAISQFIIWSYDQNPEISKEEAISAFGRAIHITSAIEKGNEPVVHISGSEPVSTQAKDYDRSDLAYRA